MVHGSNHVVPLERSPVAGQVSTEQVDRSWRQKSTESQRVEISRSRASSWSSSVSSTQPSSPRTLRSSVLSSPGKAVLAAAIGPKKRRQVVTEVRKTLPPVHVVKRHTVRVPQRGVLVGQGGLIKRSAVKRGTNSASSSSTPPRSSASQNTPRNPGRSTLSPLGKYRAGVFTVEAMNTFADSSLAGGRGSGGSSGGNCGVAASGRGGAGEAGPAVGSPQESQLVAHRKDGRVRHPGPILPGTGGRRPASSVMLGLKPRRGGPSLVSAHICIGAREDARNLESLKELGVTHVLNCAKQLPSLHAREFVHARLELLDTNDEELAHFQNAGVSFLRHVEGCGGRALVHCIAGCSRSVSIVLLHLMESHRIRLKVAYDHVRSFRMVAQPNEGFRFQLATAEVKMFGSSSVSRDAESIWNFYRWNEVKQGVPYHAIEPRHPCSCCIMS